MFRVSNNLVGILNFFTFLLSVPILGAGIWLANRATTDCEKFLEKPVIVIGVFLMAVSIAGLVGSCCRVSCLLWTYLLVMFVLIVLLFCFTIFAFLVTNHGAGRVLEGKGYKEYKLGDYSTWLQDRVNNADNWRRIQSCLKDSSVCTSMANGFPSSTAAEFYNEHLSSVQSGCCKPSDECGFTYVSPTRWTGTVNNSNTNSDCALWNNDANILCYNCQSCKAGLLDSIKSDWKKVAVVNVIFLIFLIIVYSIGCCAFRNNREDNYFSRKPYP